MSAISTILTRLRAAIWAIDVRDDIANAIEQCYSDVSNPTLQTEALEAALQNKIDEGEMAALTIGDHTITAEKLAQGVIDNTLATSGAAADAKKTGDELTAIKADLGSFKVVGGADKYFSNIKVYGSPTSIGISNIRNNYGSAGAKQTGFAIFPATTDTEWASAIKNVTDAPVSGHFKETLKDGRTYEFDYDLSSLASGTKDTVRDAAHIIKQSCFYGGFYDDSTLTERISALGDAICACLNNVVFENTDDGNQLIESIRRISHGSPVSLTASFDPGSNIIYGYYTLASLKKYLTVTARYNNGEIQTVTDYTLSGNLESENSIITVTYDGVTTTFNVNVNIGRALTASDVVNNGGFNNFTVDANGSITFSSANTFSILTFPNITHISFILTPKVGTPFLWWVSYNRIADNSQYYCNDGEKFFKFTKSGNQYNSSTASGVGTVIRDITEQSGNINRAGMKIENQNVHCYYRGAHYHTTNANILGLWQSNMNYGNITNVRVYDEV